MEVKTWQDTVMSDEQIYNAKAYAYNKANGTEAGRDFAGDKGIAMAQAEISFKAGRRDVIEEVVEWVDGVIEAEWQIWKVGKDLSGMGSIHRIRDKWQAIIRSGI